MNYAPVPCLKQGSCFRWINALWLEGTCAQRHLDRAPTSRHFALCPNLLFRCRQSWRAPLRIHVRVAIVFSPWKTLSDLYFVPGLCRRVGRSVLCSFPEPPPPPSPQRPRLDVRHTRKTFGKKVPSEPYGRDEDPSFPSSSKKNSKLVNSCGSQWWEDLVLIGVTKDPSCCSRGH